VSGLVRGRAESPKLARVFKDVRSALQKPREEVMADPSRKGRRERMLIYDATNLEPELGDAYELKEAFRSAMAIGKSGDAATFEVALDLFIAWCRLSGILAFVTVANTFSNWRAEILNYARSGGASKCTPIRTRTCSPAGQSWASSARCISITAATQALGEENTAKNPSPWVLISLPSWAERLVRMR
jgi:hypothetical protein